LSHAIIDALLGAAGLGDIGTLFPDTDARYENISSLTLLAEVFEKLTASNWCVVNIDATVIAQRPKLAPYKLEMSARIAATLGIDPSAVNIKAKTEEGLGFTGTEQGIAAQAVCLLTREPKPNFTNVSKGQDLA